MIRDPSDGSVREATGGESQKAPVIPRKPPVDTGLRQPTRTDAQIRLERSREWLKDYHASKHGEKADDLVRGDNESELPSQG